ncbi:TonB-dependent receptor [Novosphingobium sp. MBES04]|uniref:TonB-dependent receptor n=1 Tax=Novosphingobium sp. MBES04 TaxID=1206458 RepID=UPI00072323CC|nr:TonB-dependent receptor [Novosphingobium sp. MBES04]GAM03009.1 TonB-dependent receptor [Novosphingobium sp. MBES04]
MMMRRNLSAVLLSATILGGLAGQAHAQTGGQDNAAPAAEPAFNEIIVSAQRRSESLQDVPLSLSAVTSDALETRQINNLASLSAAAPSLQVDADNNFSVRGVGTLSFSNTIDTSVALAMDEVNLGRPDLGAPMLMDVERVEVLNGPQGLLFGKNASAGLINIVTARPVIGEFSGSTEIQASNRATPQADRNAPAIIAKQVLNIPVSENSALRLNALYGYQESPLTRIVGVDTGDIPYINVPRRNHDADRNMQFKAKYLYEGMSGLSVYLIGDYNRIKSGLSRFNQTYRQVEADSPVNDIVADAGSEIGPDMFLELTNGGFYQDLKTGGAQAAVSYEFDSGFQISNIFAWRYSNTDQNLDVDALPVSDVDTNYSTTNYDQFTNELRLILPDTSRLTGQAGLFFLSSRLNATNLLAGNQSMPDFVLSGFPFCVGATVTPGGPPNCSVSNDFFLGRSYDATLDTTSYAAFGQLTYELADGLTVFGGGRVTRDQVDLDVEQGQVRTFVNLGVDPGTFEDSYKNTNFSWKLGGQYEPTEDIMFYGFYGRGYKGPGFNTTAITGDDGIARVVPIDPETSDAFEIGIKTSWFDHRLTLNVSAFQTKFDNFQVQSFDTALRTFVVQNAAKVKSRGVEVTLGARPVPGLSIDASATFLDATYDDFPGAECYIGQSDCGPDGTFNAGGQTLPLSPKFTSTVQAMYELPVSGPVVPFIQGNWYHRSSVNYLINGAPGADYGAADTFGFSAGVNFNDRLRASLFCNNCTNEHIPSSIITDAGEANAGRLAFTQRYGLNAVRQIGFQLQFDY